MSRLAADPELIRIGNCSGFYGDRIGAVTERRTEKGILDRHGSRQQAVTDTFFQQAQFKLCQFVSAPIHASISGTVMAVGDVRLANGLVTKGVTIKSDGEMRLFDGLTPPAVNPSVTARAIAATLAGVAP